MPPTLRPTADQRERAEELLKLCAGLPEKAAVLRLKALVLLMDGISSTEVAKRLRRTPQRISQIKFEAIERGLDTELLLLGEELERIASSLKPKRPLAGRPGSEAWEEYAASSESAGEPYVEIANLVITSSLQAAVFVTGRVTRRTKDGEFPPEGEGHATPLFVEKLHRLIAGVAEQEKFEMPPWTRVSALDDICCDLFDTLESEVSRLRLEDVRQDLSTVVFSPLRSSPPHERFPAAGMAAVIWAGDACAAAKFFEAAFESRKTAFVDYQIAEPRNFSRALATVIFGSHNSVTGVGTLPCSWLMLWAVNDFAFSKYGALVWIALVGQVNLWLRRRLAIRDFLALKGVLMGHNAFLAPRIPYRPSVKFTTFSTATRVKVVNESKETGVVTLAVRPLPECEYRISFKAKASGESAAKGLRTLLRQSGHSTSRRLVYTPGPAALSDAMPGQEEVEAWISGRSGSGEPRHLTLLPRHLLRRDCTSSLDGLHWKPNAVTTTDLLREGGKEAGAILDLSILREAFWNAFQENRIGDHVKRLMDWNFSLGCLASLRRKQKQIEWIAGAMAFANSVPNFWWLPSDGSAEGYDARMNERLKLFSENAKEEVVARLDMDGGAPVALVPKLLELLRAARNAKTDQERAEAASRYERESIAEKEARAVKHFPKGFKPSIDNDRTFITVLRELDADYLISHLRDGERADLDAIIEKWIEHCAEVVVRAFWPKGRFDYRRLSTALPDSVLWAVSPEVMEDIASEALTPFRFGRQRVFRWAIETAQRQILGNRTPVFAVAETESETIRSWRSYVSSFSLRWSVPAPTTSLNELNDKQEKVVDAAAYSPDEPEDPWDDRSEGDLEE